MLWHLLESAKSLEMMINQYQKDHSFDRLKTGLLFQSMAANWVLMEQLSVISELLQKSNEVEDALPNIKDTQQFFIIELTSQGFLGEHPIWKMKPIVTV